jgi:hypothetical protein
MLAEGLWRPSSRCCNFRATDKAGLIFWNLSSLGGLEVLFVSVQLKTVRIIDSLKKLSRTNFKMSFLFVILLLLFEKTFRKMLNRDLFYLFFLVGIILVEVVDAINLLLPFLRMGLP